MSDKLYAFHDLGRVSGRRSWSLPVVPTTASVPAKVVLTCTGSLNFLCSAVQTET